MSVLRETSDRRILFFGRFPLYVVSRTFTVVKLKIIRKLLAFTTKKQSSVYITVLLINLIIEFDVTLSSRIISGVFTS